ncbi:Os07g0122150 [Oryza sativa Japonica Group]|uniref:Os07g0122150 protein n=1 Tax=Oryza sativa subsp. japonica TaxID=39947 RepID=A0A0P0X1X0_ORYSJ|nr:Os07g0122150 [Oryza sativa Japonica Group]
MKPSRTSISTRLAVAAARKKLASSSPHRRALAARARTNGRPHSGRLAAAAADRGRQRHSPGPPCAGMASPGSFVRGGGGGLLARWTAVVAVVVGVESGETKGFGAAQVIVN